MNLKAEEEGDRRRTRWALAGLQTDGEEGAQEEELGTGAASRSREEGPTQEPNTAGHLNQPGGSSFPGAPGRGNAALRTLGPSVSAP